jgi:hypothetical protein
LPTKRSTLSIHDEHIFNFSCFVWLDYRYICHCCWNFEVSEVHNDIQLRAYSVVEQTGLTKPLEFGRADLQLHVVVPLDQLLMAHSRNRAMQRGFLLPPEVVLPVSL